jgi:hypothetical protein
VPILGKIILWSILPLLKYFATVVELIGSLKWVNLSINFNWVILLGWYLILIWIYLKLKSPLHSLFEKEGKNSKLRKNYFSPPFVKGGVRGRF